MTRACSPELTRRPGRAGDDNALPTYGLRTKVRRMERATLTEHKWIISGERRGTMKRHDIETVSGLPHAEAGGRTVCRVVLSRTH